MFDRLVTAALDPGSTVAVSALRSLWLVFIFSRYAKKNKKFADVLRVIFACSPSTSGLEMRAVHLLLLHSADNVRKIRTFTLKLFIFYLLNQIFIVSKIVFYLFFASICR